MSISDQEPLLSGMRGWLWRLSPPSEAVLPLGKELCCHAPSLGVVSSLGGGGATLQAGLETPRLFWFSAGEPLAPGRASKEWQAGAGWPSEVGGGALVLSKRDPRGPYVSSHQGSAPRHSWDWGQERGLLGSGAVVAPGSFPGHPEAGSRLLVKTKLRGHWRAGLGCPAPSRHSLASESLPRAQSLPQATAPTRVPGVLGPAPGLPAPGLLLPSLSSRLSSRILLPSFLRLSGLVAAWPEGFQRYLTLQPLGATLSLFFNPPNLLSPIPRTGDGVWGPGVQDTFLKFPFTTNDEFIFHCQQF